MNIKLRIARVISFVGIFIGISCAGNSNRYTLTNVDSACRNGDTNFFAYNLAKINSMLPAREANHFTYALILAAENGQYDLMEYLLGVGADVTVSDSRGDTALHQIMNSWRIPPAKLIKELQNRGLDINRTNRFGETALHLACGIQRPLIVTLLELGADPNSRTADGSTPLFYVSNTNAAATLIGYGASLHIKNAKGESLLTFFRRTKPEIAEFFSSSATEVSK